MYMKIFTRVLLELGYNVMTLCPNPFQLEEWIQKKLPDFSHQFRAFKINEPQSLSTNRFLIKIPRISQGWWHWYNAACVIRRGVKDCKTEPSLVFFNYLDDYLYFNSFFTHLIVSAIFQYRWAGLFFNSALLRKPDEYARLGGLDNRYLSLRSSKCHSVGVLDEGIAYKLQEVAGRTRVVVFPDITDNTKPTLGYHVVQKIINRAGKRKIIGLVGSQEKRKGVLTFLKIASQCTDKPWFFVFAGKLAKNTFNSEELRYIKNMTKSFPSNCFFYFDFIPQEAQFNAIINICDCLYAAYKAFAGSSNILTKAAIFEKPVIVSKGFCMEERVKKFNLGLSVQEGKVEECINAISFLMERNVASVDVEIPNYENFRENHSEKQLKKAFIQVLHGIGKN